MDFLFNKVAILKFQRPANISKKEKRTGEYCEPLRTFFFIIPMVVTAEDELLTYSSMISSFNECLLK